MKIKVLSSAIEDLYEGRLFYEKQGEGLGEYFPLPAPARGPLVPRAL